MGKYGHKQSEETKRKISEAKKGTKASDATKKKLSEIRKGHVVSEEARLKISKANTGKIRSPEVREKISKAKMGCRGPNLGKTFSEETCQNISRSLLGNKNASGTHNIPEESRVKMAAAHKGNQTQLGRKHTTDECQRMSEGYKYHAPHKGKKFSDETKKKLSGSKKGSIPWNKGKTGVYSNDTLKVMSELKAGVRAPLWKGGISYEPYCNKFNEHLKEKVREQFNRKCLICGIPEGDRHLSVHHCDFNKMQGCGKRPWNLVPLCLPCHTKTNHNRWYWFSLLYNHWALNPEITI